VITREVYVAYDGLPHDPEPAKQWFERQFANAKDGATFDWLPTTGTNAWDTSELVHNNFDRLADPVCEPRSRDDLISLRWFGYLEDKLKACDGVRKFVDKFIAHAADPLSREGLTREETAITLDRLRTCHRAIYQTAAFIYGPLLWEGSCAVPVPQHDHLENLDKRWITPGEREQARELWDTHFDLVKAWEQESLWPTEAVDTNVPTIDV
jgi:hypothetical protein